MQVNLSMPKNTSSFISYAKAVNSAIHQLMKVDSSIVIIGEGVPDPKAIFGTTSGLMNKFGAERVFDMPLSENGVTGVCIGASLTGLKPILIHQRIDFSLLALDQVINNAAKWFYIFNGQASVPIVIRMIMGRGWGQGPQHSQGLHSIYSSIPGLKVVMPSSPYDVKGMLVSAVRDPNPVIFIEHRWLHSIKDDVPDRIYEVELNKANVLFEGVENTLTIVALSYAAIESLEAARAIYRYYKLKIEVIDLRSVRPIDYETITASVSKTGRILFVDQAFASGGISGEVLSIVSEICFDSLKSPPARITMPDHPVPTSHYMTDGYYPGPLEIAKKVLTMLDFEFSGDAYKELVSDLEIVGFHDIPNRNFKGPF